MRPEAQRRRGPVLTALLIAPLVATAGVALFASAPRSPVAYCRVADQFFNNLPYSAAAHRNGGDETAGAQVLSVDSDQARPHAPAALRPDWDRIHAAAVRLKTTGAAAGPTVTQAQIDSSLQRVYRDYRNRCDAYQFAGVSRPPLDTAGLVGQPPGVAYCQRALTLFSDLVSNSHGTDRFARDRLVSEAESVANVLPPELTDDWGSTVGALRRLQRTGSSFDAGHPQAMVDGALNRLVDDYSSRCPTPIPIPKASG